MKTNRPALYIIVIAITLLSVLGCKPPRPPRPTITLEDAVGSGNIEQARSNMYYGCDVNENNLLLTSVKNSDYKMAKLLLDNGALLRDNVKGDLLLTALFSDNKDIVKLLFDHGINKPPDLGEPFKAKGADYAREHLLNAMVSGDKETIDEAKKALALLESICSPVPPVQSRTEP